MKKPFVLDNLMAEIGAIETLKQALVLYETVGMRAMSLSPRTRKEYANDLADLVAYFEKGGITRPEHVTLAYLRVYIADLERRGYQASTRNRRVHTVKGFFRFLHDYTVVHVNVARHLIRRRWHGENHVF